MRFERDNADSPWRSPLADLEMASNNFIEASSFGRLAPFHPLRCTCTIPRAGRFSRPLLKLPTTRFRAPLALEGRTLGFHEALHLVKCKDTMQWNPRSVEKDRPRSPRPSGI